MRNRDSIIEPIRVHLRMLSPCVLMLLSLWISTAHAASPRWPESLYVYESKSFELSNVFQDLFLHCKMPCFISEKVKGKFSGNFNAYPREVFEQLVKTSGVVAYYDGIIMNIYDAGEIESKYISLKRLTHKKVVEAFKTADLIDERYPVAEIVPGVIRLVGPPRLVQTAEEVLKILEANQEGVDFKQESEVSIDVIPLRFATASDHPIQLLDRVEMVPGIVSVLRKMWGKTDLNPSDTALPKGITAVARAASVTAPADTKLPSVQPAKAESIMDSDSSGSLPVFQSHSTRNAVIVRDYTYRLARYRDIINKIDVPSASIEIKADILDVNSTKLKESGIDWRYKNNSNLQVGMDNLVLGMTPTPLSGLNYAAIVGSSAQKFLARVRLMEGKGDARVSSKPTLLTLENQEAQVEFKQTIYVRVAGYQDVALFPISAGVLLRVVPSRVVVHGKQKVKIRISIEDGAISAQKAVDEIPQVDRSMVNTEVVLDNNEPLLIGGLQKETNRKNRDQVPGLGKIPVLGLFFSKDSSSEELNDRFFLITPRVVDDNNASSVPETKETHSEAAP